MILSQQKFKFILRSDHLQTGFGDLMFVPFRFWVSNNTAFQERQSDPQKIIPDKILEDSLWFNTIYAA